jgi:hypothetical protein
MVSRHTIGWMMKGVDNTWSERRKEDGETDRERDLCMETTLRRYS